MAAISSTELLSRIDQLAALSKSPAHLTQIYLAEQHLAAKDLVLGWMRATRMTAAGDPVRNVVGRYEGNRPSLPSGAGHDAMAMADLTDIAMPFIRCTDGITHNPAEAIAAPNAETAARVLLRSARTFRPHTRHV